MAASLCALEAALADATPASPSDAAKCAREGSNSGSDGDRTEPSLMIRGDIVGDICDQVLLTTTRRAIPYLHYSYAVLYRALTIPILHRNSLESFCPTLTSDCRLSRHATLPPSPGRPTHSRTRRHTSRQNRPLRCAKNTLRARPTDSEKTHQKKERTHKKRPQTQRRYCPCGCR